MAHKTAIDNAIQILSSSIDESPRDYTLYMERGKLYHQKGLFHLAMNDFRRAAEIRPDNMEAEAYIEMITEILEYRYKDIYNP